MISIDDTLSEDFGTDPDSPAYAEGPFYILHNGIPEVGSHLIQIDDEMQLSGETRAFTFDDTYMVSVSDDGNRVYLRSDKYDSTFDLRPLRLEDAEELYPEYVFLDLEHFKMFAEEQLVRLNSIYGETVQINYGVTLDEDGSVLDLVRSDNTGVFVRDNGRWIALDLESEDESDTIDGYEWVDVTADAIEFFDSNGSVDGLTRLDIAPYAVN